MNDRIEKLPPASIDLMWTGRMLVALLLCVGILGSVATPATAQQPPPPQTSSKSDAQTSTDETASCQSDDTSGPLSLVLIILGVLGLLLFRHSERLALVGLAILLVIWLVFGVTWDESNSDPPTSDSTTEGTSTQQR